MVLNRDVILNVFLATAVALTAFFIYLPTLTSGFIWDDVYMFLNPIQMGENPYSFFFGGKTYYRPLIHLSMAIDYSFWHLNPVGYHLTNILLHIINSLLVFLVGYNLLRYKAITTETSDKEKSKIKKVLMLSFFAAMTFAIHPINIESVAWISGRTDILSALFFLLAFLSFMIYERKGEKVALFISSIFFLFSLFSKENGIAFIGVAIVFGIIEKMPKKKLYLSFFSLSIVIVIYFFFRNGFYLIEKLTADPISKTAIFTSGITVTNFLKVLFLGIGYYFEKLAFPFNLNLMPLLPQNPIYYLIFLLPFVFCVILYFTGHRLKSFLIIWIVVTLSPSLLILHTQVAAPIAVRYLYLPSAGFCILLALILASIKNRKAIIFSVFTLLLIIYTASAHERIKVWKNPVTLWADTVEKSPNSVSARLNFGVALLRKGDKDKARDELLIALKQKKAGVRQVSHIYELLGHVELKAENYRKAEEYLINSIKINPINVIAYNSLGLVYYRMLGSAENNDKKMEIFNKAISNYKRSLELSPEYMFPKYNLGLCYLKVGEFEKAEEYFNLVIDSDPQSDQAINAVKFINLIKTSDRKDLMNMMK